jgi:hypothetical protein
MVVAKMSEGQDTIVGMMKVCPMHEGAFDCNPFCRICEGEQEYEYTGFLPCNRFGHCGNNVEEDIWHEELGFCVDCSNLYFDQQLDPFTLERLENA